MTGSITAVVSRIERIESQYGPRQLADRQVVVPGPEFDAFGETYQQALATRGAAPSSSSVTSAISGVGAFATRIPGYGGPTGSSFAGSASFAGSSVSGTGSSVGQVGGYGTMPVPTELQQFGNGRIPSEALRPIQQSGHRLYAPASVAWDRMVDAARAEGFDLRITDSYRSFEQQVDLANRKGLYKNGGLAATPGTSNHGWGLAVDADVRDPALLAWVRDNAHRFGFVEAVPREPWHWEFRPHQA